MSLDFWFGALAGFGCLIICVVAWCTLDTYWRKNWSKAERACKRKRKFRLQFEEAAGYPVYDLAKNSKYRLDQHTEYIDANTIRLTKLEMSVDSILFGSTIPEHVLLRNSDAIKKKRPAKKRVVRNTKKRAG